MTGTVTQHIRIQTPARQTPSTAEEYCEVILLLNNAHDDYMDVKELIMSAGGR